MQAALGVFVDLDRVDPLHQRKIQKGDQAKMTAIEQATKIFMTQGAVGHNPRLLQQALKPGTSATAGNVQIDPGVSGKAVEPVEISPLKVGTGGDHLETSRRRTLQQGLAAKIVPTRIGQQESPMLSRSTHATEQKGIRSHNQIGAPAEMAFISLPHRRALAREKTVAVTPVIDDLPPGPAGDGCQARVADPAPTRRT